jgi:ABC-type branched-subunit amino acid transport system ATPase component
MFTRMISPKTTDGRLHPATTSPGIAQDIEKMFNIFRACASAGQLASCHGGEQQMLAMARAHGQPKNCCSTNMGLSPIMVDKELFGWCAMSKQGTTILLVRQNASPRAADCADRGYGVMVSGGNHHDRQGRDLQRH